MLSAHCRTSEFFYVPRPSIDITFATGANGEDGLSVISQNQGRCGK